MPTPSTYCPLSPEQFIGGARMAAQQLQRAVDYANKHGRQPIKMFVGGKPGLGKSALAKYLAHLLGCNKWNTTKKNGTQLKVEAVDEISADLCTTSLFGDWRSIIIEESDKIPTVAQVRMLTLLDDLPNGVAIICTSNCALKDFEPRFISRFQCLVGPRSDKELDAPTSDEVAGLLRQFITDEHAIQQIATFACGNVRQAMLDAEGCLQLVA